MNNHEDASPKTDHPVTVQAARNQLTKSCNGEVFITLNIEFTGRRTAKRETDTRAMFEVSPILVA